MTFCFMTSGNLRSGRGHKPLVAGIIEVVAFYVAARGVVDGVVVGKAALVGGCWRPLTVVLEAFSAFKALA